MYQFSLNGDWQLFQATDKTAIPAQVPGCVHTDLLANQLLQDPFYRDNELQQMWIGETDWRYTRTFSVSPELLTYERLLLCCHGLDTIATLFLNGTEIGRADNMYRTWEYDLKPYVQLGENTLEIAFESPMQFARRMDEEKGEMAGWVEPMRINSGAWIRKEPCNFGWDWGPKMVTSGIWRDIEIIAFNTARLADIHLTQEHHSSSEVHLAVKIRAEQIAETPLQATVKVSLRGETLITETLTLNTAAGEIQFAIPDPELWWVNNMGAQPLYDVVVTLLADEGHILDTHTQKIGLRTLTLERHADEWGESFYFACNGVPFFAKGANWIPASPYPAATTAADYERLIMATAAANMNMLRVWGGGIYEDNYFYELCSQYGIAVWQDFMFACGTYPSFDADFMANVQAEAEDNLRRLRHQACMALWCGNNEIEQGMPSSPGWQDSMSWADYSRLFDELLPSIVQELAPQTAYWPGSPHSSLGDRNNHMNPACGDTHLWGVWHGKEPFEWYRSRLDRFCSEFGFQSFPEPAVVYEFTEPQDRNITSYVMEHHQRSGIGNSTIIHYLLDWFRLPASFESTLWLSQILQGLAMKYAVEHWRRNMPRSMGALYWQLNDLWAAPSWASLDWKGNWKALHYMARRFYAPLLVSGLEDTAQQTLEIHVTSDAMTAQTGTVRYRVTDTTGDMIAGGSLPIKIAPRTTQCIHVFELAQVLKIKSARDLLIWLELQVNKETVSENLVTLSRPKHLNLQQPHLQYELQLTEENQGVVKVWSDVPALYVWLEGGEFSDNFFHLQAHKPRFVSVKNPTNLKIASLVDTYS